MDKGYQYTELEEEDMDAAKAIRYNAAARGVNFKLLELPAPYKTNEPGTRRFAEMV